MNGFSAGMQRGETMRIEAIAWFDVPNNGKWHGQNVMPQQELIRCKDCKHRPYRDDDGMIDGDYVCPYLCDDPFYTVMPKDDWFCHRAERRKE